ncbi:hypothetical protein QN379_12225 [Glaciimonas sp. Gout2]|uniref:hypothetical protein n=1 Tax=unclassified Glaciimonas TaxID=2644401 RepID=UPI002B23D3B7|nr:MULTISPECIES: hypothetical protein [unclassified Glaciimonas]MEB0011983.1 hypothetical protein [Glaciimonas sp. Cout2]MEB0082781.1 hypothetical protein [Glaciimonas sp. Gout2]
MTTIELPFRATTAQACHWLAQQTGSPWTLARMIESGLTPYVWLEYDTEYPALFGDANGGYPAPIFFEGDTQRLAAGSEDVLITITKDVYRIVAQLKPPGFRRALHELRFLKKDLERLTSKLKREEDAKTKADAKAKSEPISADGAKESQSGINKDQALIAFASLVKIDLQKALDAGGGIFGDDGARVKASTKKAKNKAVWNPITLALGLNDVYRVPMPHLKRAFNTHDFLAEWSNEWNQALVLLGK